MARRYNRGYRNYPRYETKNFNNQDYIVKHDNYQRRGYYKRRYKNNKPSLRSMNITTGIPDRYMMKMKYSTTVEMTGIGGVTGTHIFRGNSIYDPDLSGIGGQPLGHDQWANFYREYTVNGSKMDVKILNLNTTASNSTTIVTVNPSEVAMSGGINAISLPEYPYVRYKLLPAASGGNLPKTIVNYISTKKIFGIKDVLDEDYSALMSTNPARQWFWNINATNIQGNDSYTVVMLVTITYYVELKSRVLLQTS